MLHIIICDISALKLTCKNLQQNKRNLPPIVIEGIYLQEEMVSQFFFLDLECSIDFHLKKKTRKIPKSFSFTLKNKNILITKRLKFICFNVLCKLELNAFFYCHIQSHHQHHHHQHNYHYWWYVNVIFYCFRTTFRKLLMGKCKFF